MRLFDLLALMDYNAYIFVKKGESYIYKGMVEDTPRYIFNQDVIHQAFYSDGGACGICFELL